MSKGLGPGGAERLLVAAAAAIDHDEFDVDAAYVLPWKDHLAGELESNGVTATCLSTRRRDALWPWRLRTAMDGVDIVHSHSPVPAVAARLASLTLPRSRRPALMTTEHNSWASHRRPTRWANRLTSGLDDYTIAVTDEAAASLRGAAARRVEVITHGIDVAGIAGTARSRKDMRASLDVGDGEIVIGTVANFRAQKDYPNLLHAARAMTDAGVAFRIVAVGQGPDEDSIVALRDRLGLENHVLFAGFRADAVDVMAACDIFVLASAWEGLPVAVMEALALGLPVVATRVGGVTESLDEAEAALVPPRDPAALAAALIGLVTDPDQRTQRGEAAVAAASRFDVAHATKEITDRYVELAAARSPAGSDQLS
ncbi:glycosyltransferase, partial [Ilumatobacter sp.]|uniref:glycosyltransferase n=1 Tax=Ilumatobacter sp. TaxID=1967498 RepID=UPI003C6B363C